MKINLKDVKQLEVDKACQSILHCNTVDKSHVSQYIDGKFKATVLLADETDVLTAYVYDMEVLELFSLGHLDQECKFAISFQKRSMFLIKIAK